MPHVFIVHSSSALYGSDRGLLNTVDYLTQSPEFTVSVAIPSSGPLELELQKRRCVVYLVEPGVLRSFPPIWKLAVFAREQFQATCKLCHLITAIQPDIVHSNTTRMIAPAIAAYLMRIPHTCHVREINDQAPRLAPTIARILRTLSVHAIAVSKVCRDYFIGTSGYNRISVIYDGIELGKFRCQSREEREIVYIGMAGWIAERKGQHLFVQTVKELLDRGYRVKGLIAGGIVDERHRPYLEQLLIMINNMGIQDHIQLVGFQNHIESFLANLDIFVMPSILQEGAGLVAVEAMGACLPVVGFNLGGVAEIVKNSVTGFLVPIDVTALANKLETLVKDTSLRNQMGQAGRARCQTLFNSEFSAQHMRDFFITVCMSTRSNKPQHLS